MKLKHHLGQNLLEDEKMAQKIVDAANVSKNDVVLEVGTGTGFLTKLIAEKAKFVYSVEKDIDIFTIAKQNLKRYNNIALINEDVLKFDLKSFEKKYIVIGNIPYYLTQKLIMMLLESANPPMAIYMTIQAEVGYRLSGVKKYRSALSIMSEYLADIRIVFDINKKYFNPVPKVDSCLIEIILKQKQVFSLKERKKFFNFIKVGFSHRRKKLKNNIKSAFTDEKELNESFIKNDIDQNARPQDLDMNDWINLYKSAYEKKLN